jgi:hypothetical protein
MSLPVFQRLVLPPSLGRSGLITLMMEAVQTSETLVNSYQSTRLYNPEDSHLHSLLFLPPEFFFLLFSHSAADIYVVHTGIFWEDGLEDSG